ncbi:hypothetical protein [Argonema galeatum]|nr:hypothetical protein [Argonema galeatum]
MMPIKVIERAEEEFTIRVWFLFIQRLLDRVVAKRDRGVSDP